MGWSAARAGDAYPRRASVESNPLRTLPRTSGFSLLAGLVATSVAQIPPYNIVQRLQLIPDASTLVTVRSRAPSRRPSNTSDGKSAGSAPLTPPRGP